MLREETQSLPNPNLNTSSLDDISFLDKYVTFYFVNPLVEFARHPSNPTVTLDNLWHISETDKVESLIKTFDEKRKNSPSGKAYLRPLYYVARGRILCGGLCMLIRMLSEVGMPVLVREIVAKMQDNDSNGIYYVIALFVVSIAGQAAMQGHLLCMEIAANRMRAVSNYAVYRHALALRQYNTSSTTGCAAVVTLVASDTQRFVDLHSHVHLLWASPMQIILGSYFMVTFLGWPALCAVGVMMSLYPVSYGMSTIQGRLRRGLLPLTVERVRWISEFLQGVKIVKMYGWEPFLIKVVNAVRVKELRYLAKELTLWVISTNMMITIPLVAILLTFWIYIASGKALSAADAFGTLSMLTLLKFPVLYFGNAVMISAQTLVASKRIASFLEASAEDSDGVVKGATQGVISMSHEPIEAHAAKLKNASFLWKEKVDTFQLHDASLELEFGKTYAVLGAVGAGKSMLCHALLRETYQSGGHASLPDAVAYCSQEPFLFSGTVRDNILFFRPFDEAKYTAVIDVCQLWEDLESYPDGEMTVVGERGVTLSGGQKARIALARVAYSAGDCDLVILDDPFSALDVRTGRLILRRIFGPSGMLRGKYAVVLVTHVRQHLKWTDYAIDISQGSVTVTPCSREQDVIPSIFEEEEDQKEGGTDDDPSSTRPTDKRRIKEVSTDKLVKVELTDKPVRLSTYADFVRYAGGWKFLLSILAGLGLERVSFVAGDVWLAIWTSADKGPPRHQVGRYFGFPRGNHIDGAAFYLITYAVIIGVTVAMAGFRLGAFARGGYTCSRRLFGDAFVALTRRPMIFFDTNTTGRILNRMSHDVERVAYPLITQLNASFASICGWMLTSVIVTAIISPFNLTFVLPAVVIMFYYIAKFRIINVHLQRIDSCARSDLQSHIFESLTGAITVRAFRRQESFLQRCRELVDGNTKALLGAAYATRWVSMRGDMLGALVLSTIALVAFLLRAELEPGLAGVAIIWGVNFSRSITFAISEGIQGEAKLVSLERLCEYANCEDEEPPRHTENQPLPSWPHSGCIQFEKVKMRYRENLPLVLNETSFQIMHGQRVGVVGRTGSGKSSLIVALFRLRELIEGSIRIDGTDISMVGLDALRGGKICIIPQDPVLFSGTIRSNVDPFQQYSDEEVRRSLEAVEFAAYLDTIGGLEALVEDRGKNFSVGQKQLVCISRALLRKPRILLMDEATANVDNETDLMIQRAVRSLFSDATVVEIAHRLQTVADSDVVIVMGEGRVLEMGTPWDLLENSSRGEFNQMVMAAGPAVAKEIRDVAVDKKNRKS